MASFEKSDERLALEERILGSHQQAQKDTFMWVLKHPLRGIPALAMMVATGTIPEDVSRAWRGLPSWQDYIGAYRELEGMEEQDGYPAMHAIAERLDNIREALPEENRKNGYYIYPGTDFYWARLFDFTIFEDRAYFQDYSPNMWWEPEQYGVGSLVATLAKLREAGVLTPDNAVRLLKGDSDTTTAHNNFNRPEYTLIEKSGHSVVDFLRSRYKGEALSFGAVIAGSHVGNEEKFIREMAELGYTLVHHEEGERIIAPYTMGIGDVRVFLKKD